jgi:hypothetical protein
MQKMLGYMEDNFPPAADATNGYGIRANIQACALKIINTLSSTQHQENRDYQNQHGGQNSTWASYRIWKIQLVKCLFTNAKCYQCDVIDHSKRACHKMV